MVKKIFLILFFFTSCSLWAQTKPPQASGIMEKTVQKYNALSAFSFDFSVIIENSKKQTENFTGILFVKKEKYFLTFEDQIIANDGKISWNYQKNTNEASLFDADEDDFSIYHPSKLLNNWNNEYEAKVIREEEQQKKQVILVDLSPKKKSSFYKIRLFIDKTTSYIQKMMMYEVDGTTITYTITKFTPNVAVDDTKFTFNKNEYPDVQINDMR
jgi:outer membrane lipoprotein-sorting protein